MINWDEPIEVKYSGVWSDAGVKYIGQQLVLLSSLGIEYACEKDSSLIWVRNKQKEPEEKWRPFREDELDRLFGRIIRLKSNINDKCMITRIVGRTIQTFESEHTARTEERWYTACSLLEYYELKQYGKWGPCGVKES